jgi:hypothetical protein
MLKTIPWDVWIAVVIAIIDVFAAIFQLAPTLFIAVYVALCGHIIVETFREESG